MSERFDPERRRFLSAAALATVAAEFGLPRSSSAEPKPASSVVAPPSVSRASSAFGVERQIDAGVLRVGYVETGPSTGRPVLLLHGFPYDVHSYVEVAPLLGAAGYRVIVPHLRGHGTTRFLSNATFRNG